MDYIPECLDVKDVILLIIVALYILQPEKFAHNLVLYVQGLGKLSSLPITGSWNSRSRTTSQSELHTVISLFVSCYNHRAWLVQVQT